MSDSFFEYSRMRDQRDRLLALVNRAIVVCQEHIVPNGFSADVSMGEMIAIFDGPEQRAAMSSDYADPREMRLWRDSRQHTTYQGEDGYVWHQSCLCDRCRQIYEQSVAEQQAQTPAFQRQSEAKP
jgi:hypothetical protein